MADVQLRNQRRVGKKYLKIKAAAKRRHFKKSKFKSKCAPHVTTVADQAEGYEEWIRIGTPDDLLPALRDLHFCLPTEIQKLAIPPAVREDKDIIGAAETGSGKTLAYAIPVLAKALPVSELEKGRQKKRMNSKNKERPPSSKKFKSEERIIDLNKVIHVRQVHAQVRKNEVGIIEPEPRELIRRQKGKVRTSSGSDQDLGGFGDSDISEGGDGEFDNDGSFSDKFNDSGSDDNGSDDSRSDDGGSDDGDDSKSQEMSLGECTYVQDDIPEHEFQALLKGERSESAKAKEQMIVREDNGGRKGPLSLIIVPTRELGLQVRDHMKLAAKHTAVKVVAVVGGIALQKQERQLRSCPHVVVATPGRLWKFISEGEEFLSSFDDLQTIVLDEADRMVEEGHFREVKLIMERIAGREKSENIQKFVFSATLTMKKRSFKKRKVEADPLAQLISQVGMRREGCAVVDLSRKHLLVGTLTEAKITCIEEDKDVHLYYLLLMYPRRTLVFTNTIDQLRKLKSLLELLGLHPHCLHAGMQQKQRLKNLERFVSSEQGLMLASDVAARGLDISKIEHIIHYQVPKNPDVYVHRSGRTARARSEGLSLMLVGPRDVRFYQQICKQLNKDEDLPTFPVKAQYLETLRKRVHLAQKIEKAEHMFLKRKKSDDWLIQSAKALEIDLDESLLQESRGDEGRVSGGGIAAELPVWKQELGGMLKKPLLPRGFSLKFPTFDNQHVKLGFAGSEG
jgi:ATP-dependent RNA helicase DDX24/MAK5